MEIGLEHVLEVVGVYGEVERGAPEEAEREGSMLFSEVPEAPIMDPPGIRRHLELRAEHGPRHRIPAATLAPPVHRDPPAHTCHGPDRRHPRHIPRVTCTQSR